MCLLFNLQLIKFSKISSGTDAATYNEPYDYDSLMHGSNTLFTTNSSLMTITARNGICTVHDQNRTNQFINIISIT